VGQLSVEAGGDITEFNVKGKFQIRFFNVFKTSVRLIAKINQTIKTFFSVFVCFEEMRH
jgi:hypothetical protein